MGDVDDADAFRGEAADDAEEAVAFGGREGGGGLVHDQDAGLEREGLGDLDQLLLAHAQAGDAGLGVELDAEAGEELSGGGDHGAAVEEEAGAERFAAEEDVGGDAELGDEVELLVDDGDARPFGVADAGEADGGAVDQDLAGVGGLDAGEDLHQRRLAGAVLAHERVHLAGAEVEVDAVERGHPGEMLGDAPGAKQIRAADVRCAGHASRTPPKVPPLALGGESTIDKLGRQARAGQGRRDPRWQSESGLG